MNDPNSPEAWDEIWTREGADTRRTYPSLYPRIVELVPKGADVIELGCGVGVLATMLRMSKGCEVVGFDHSPVAVELFRQQPARAELLDLRYSSHRGWLVFDLLASRPGAVVVATEVLEHLDDHSLHKVLSCIPKGAACLFSVPNNRLGPDEEPQHQRKYTALEFKRLLARYWPPACFRIECVGDYLLAVVAAEPRKVRISVTMPARNEARDIERTLRSFMAVADEMVIGIDPRSTDATRAICEQYADTVFTLASPRGPAGAEVPSDDGVHFSWIRNQCIERCTFDWIFMSEAHERLDLSSIPAVLSIGDVPLDVGVLAVVRESDTTQWLFPWLFRRTPEIRFSNPVHNVLVHPDSVKTADAPQIRTIHQRHEDNSKARAEQRKGQNREVFARKVDVDPTDARSWFYLANEHRAVGDSEDAIRCYEEYLDNSKFGPERYQAILFMAQCYAHQDDLDDARYWLFKAAVEDWSRNEHLVFLGDLAARQGRHEEALVWYRQAASWGSDVPLSPMFVDKAYYPLVPHQKLAQTYAELGDAKSALEHIGRVEHLLHDFPPYVATQAVWDNLHENKQACQMMLSSAVR
jgi:2-polyprenyl-3-methyl-5-hydroxy-6-metoxy-1,4-benzoquinol methylase/lipopolysaccharide biosynthesis regulator YciM